MVNKVASHFTAIGNPDDSTVSGKVAKLPGAIRIGMLLPLHKSGHNCKIIWEQYGIHRTEVALQTIDQINEDPKILPNFKLGIEIRDSCWTERVAVEQTIHFIQDVMELKKSDLNKCCTKSAGNSSAESCGQQEKTEGQLVAVIGPGSSANSKAVQNLLQIFRIPQIGYSATSTDLSNKEEFKYYMRVVPPDAYQAEVMVDIIRYFNWSYIAVINTEGRQKRCHFRVSYCISPLARRV